MNERIKQLRKALNLTQQELADKIGVKRSTVSLYEMGRNEPIDAIINIICEKLNVSEAWLRTGEGEMLVQKSDEQELMELFADVAAEVDDSFRRRFVRALLKLPEKEWTKIEAFMRTVLEEEKEKPQ